MASGDHRRGGARRRKIVRLQSARNGFRVEQINFDLDLGDTENLVKAVQTNLESEARYYEAIRRYNMAILELLAAAGLLTREMNAFTE